MHVHKIAHLAGLVLFFCISFPTFASNVDLTLADKEALDSAAAAMCGKSIVILGEATHGGGHSSTVKVALAKHLILQCGFNGMLFESSFYEFSPISQMTRKKQQISSNLVATAVGGVWKFDREVQTIFDFLAEQVNSGKLELGGIDFQAGGYQQPYGNDKIMEELASYLPSERRDSCRQLYRSRIYGENPPNGMSTTARTESLKSCLYSVETGIGISKINTIEKNERQREIRNLEAWLANDDLPRQELIRSRDKAMVENVVFFAERIAKPAKLIIWAHNAHAALNSFSLNDYGQGDNLGAALSRRYGKSVYALGITARGGEYRWTRKENKAVPPPPSDSLEAIYGKPDASSFIGAKELIAAGVCSSGVLGYSYARAKWADAFDGILVLNQEYPPHSARD